MPNTNLYQDLKNALNDFKTFLDGAVPTLKPAIQAAKAIFPPVGDLVGQLITLMNQLKTAVQNLNVSNIPGLSQLSTFTNAAKTLLTTAENLLPDQKPNIDSVLSVVNVVGSFPSLDTVKQDIVNLITAIIADLNSLNS
jgi:ABC-type transporter Mla subunit MlaD